MSRVKQNQNIDSLISNINSIIKSRCSLSDKDLTILNDVIDRLQHLKKKKGKTNKDILQEVVKIIKLLSQFFLSAESLRSNDIN